MGLALTLVGGDILSIRALGRRGRKGLGFILEVVGNHCRTLRNSVQFGEMGNSLFPELMSKLNMIININSFSWHKAWHGMEAQ